MTDSKWIRGLVRVGEGIIIQFLNCHNIRSFRYYRTYIKNFFILRISLCRRTPFGSRCSSLFTSNPTNSLHLPLIRSSLNREAAAPTNNSSSSQPHLLQSEPNHNALEGSDDVAAGATPPFKDAQRSPKDARHALKDMRAVFAHVLRQN